MTWETVAICVQCWIATNPQKPLADDHPAHGGHGYLERCHECGEPTRSGIYVRREVQGGAR